ncbi:MAG: hypothetical protein M1828_000540 [Chrysothrix sp. TS-e1954]|nr:MAG: hypothetical protein M1828_000540 [Chrysothrix sp. TS-e1954]
MTDDLNEEDRERRIQYHLQNAVDSYQHSAIIGIATSELVPDQNHCNTSSGPGKDEAVTQFLTVG